MVFHLPIDNFKIRGWVFAKNTVLLPFSLFFPPLSTPSSQCTVFFVFSVCLGGFSRLFALLSCLLLKHVPECFYRGFAANTPNAQYLLKAFNPLSGPLSKP